MQNMVLKIKGMHCESCARVIENALEEKGIIATVDFKGCRAKIAFDEEKIKIGDIINIIKEKGYKVF